MRPPSTLSIAMFLAAFALLLASHSPRAETPAQGFDRSFLAELATMPTGPLTAEQEFRYGELCWGRFDELIYFARKDDPAALAAIQHLILANGMPGGCSCSRNEFRGAFYGSATITEKFTALLPDYLPAEQVAILQDVDHAEEHIGFACDACWSDVRDTYLGVHPEVAALYKQAVADAARKESKEAQDAEEIEQTKRADYSAPDTFQVNGRTIRLVPALP